MRKRFAIPVLLTFSLLSVSALGLSETINFDDIVGNYVAVPSSYAGLTWGSSNQNGFMNTTGFWAVWNTAYATPQSAPNYVVNAAGVNNLWFSFATPVTFNGAYFCWVQLTTGYADSVRFKDDLGNVSDWLRLSTTPEFLAANFSGSTKIYVERAGIHGDSFYNYQYYAMDNITYNSSSAVPEPSLMLLLGIGLGAVSLAGWRRRK